MANRETSPMGFHRAQLRTGNALEAVGSLNERLDEALDEVRVAMQREAQQRQGESAQHSDDAGRSPALRGRGA